MIAIVLALAGGVGAAARAWIDGVISGRSGAKRVPWGTIGINLSGSFLIGVVAGAGTAQFSEEWQAVLSVGFLGGYTTFSTAAVQTAEMILERRWGAAMGYSFGLLVVAALLAGLGLLAGLAITSR